MAEIHTYDIGTVFEVTLLDTDVVVDIALATTKEIIFLKPSGTSVTKTAEFKTTGSDGIIQYTTILDDLNEVGGWKIQAKVTLPTGTWSSDISKFKVYSNI